MTASAIGDLFADAPRAVRPRPSSGLVLPTIVPPKTEEAAQPIGIKTPMRGIQRQGLAFLQREVHGILGWEMGVGKTLGALSYMIASGARRILVLAPAKVVGVWRGEVPKHVSLPVKVVTLGAEIGTSADKAAEMRLALASHPTDRVMIVLSHDSVWREPIKSLVYKNTWDMLIVDECDRLAGAGSKRALACATLAARCRRRIGLSGTVMRQKPPDIYAVAKIINPAIFGTSKDKFLDRYFKMGGFGGYEVVGFRAEDEFKARLHKLCMFASKKDAGIELPPVTEQVVRLELPAKVRKLHDEIARNMMFESAGAKVVLNNALEKLLRLQQLTSGLLLKEDRSLMRVHDAKAEALADLLQGIAKPVVVFAKFRADLDAIATVAKKLGRRYGEVSGRRNDLTSTAKFPPGVDVLAVQIDAGDAGIDLTAASYAVYYSLSNKVAQWRQSKARLDRPGQTEPVTFFYLVGIGTVDVAILRALRNGADVLEQLTTAFDHEGKLKAVA